MKLRAVLLVLVCLGIPKACNAEELEFLLGTWTATTDGRDLGQPVTFKKSFLGYDVVLPFFKGVSSLNPSLGEYSSHIKITSVDNDRCFYRLNILSESKFTLAVRHADSDSCPNSAVFERVKENVVVNSDSGAIDTSFFQPGPVASDDPKKFSEMYSGKWESDDGKVYFSAKGEMFGHDAYIDVFTDSGKTKIRQFRYGIHKYSDKSNMSFSEIQRFCSEFPREIENYISDKFGSLRLENSSKEIDGKWKCSSAGRCTDRRSDKRYSLGDKALISTYRQLLFDVRGKQFYEGCRLVMHVSLQGPYGNRKK